MEDALEDCGVEKFSPKPGESFKSAMGVEDRPKIEDVDDPALDMKIVGVERDGFRFSEERDSISAVILKARVVVGRYVKGEE